MAVDTDYALAMSDGVCSMAPVGTPAPVGMTALGSPWVDMGAISTDGLTESFSTDRTDFKRWGSKQKFKTVVTNVDKTFQLTFLETNPNVLGLYFGIDAPTPDPTTKIMSVIDDTSGGINIVSFVFDIVEEGTGNHARFYLPKAEVTTQADVKYATDTLSQYGVTITAYPDDAGVSVARQYKLDAVNG